MRMICGLIDYVFVWVFRYWFVDVMFVCLARFCLFEFAYFASHLCVVGLLGVLRSGFCFGLRVWVFYGHCLFAVILGCYLDDLDCLLLFGVVLKCVVCLL